MRKYGLVILYLGPCLLGACVTHWRNIPADPAFKPQAFLPPVEITLTTGGALADDRDELRACLDVFRSANVRIVNSAPIHVAVRAPRKYFAWQTWLHVTMSGAKQGEYRIPSDDDVDYDDTWPCVVGAAMSAAPNDVPLSFQKLPTTCEKLSTQRATRYPTLAEGIAAVTSTVRSEHGNRVVAKLSYTYETGAGVVGGEGYRCP